MDLSKLTPAPWGCWRKDQQSASDRPSYGGLFDQSGAPVKALVQIDHDVALDADFAEFAALARNAFDVMMRRGWYAVPHEPSKTWIAMNAFCCQIERGGNTGTYFVADDPFTALVEADKWYRENVENRGS